MNLKEFLGKLAPTAARMIGGPLAGMAVEALGEAIGMSEPTAEKIAEAVTKGTLTAEQVAAMRQADDALKVKLVELNIKLEDIAAADRKDARAMMVSTGAKTPAVLSWIVVVATLGFEGWVLIFGLPINSDPVILGRVLGTLDMAFATVLTFWLGAAHQRAQPTRASDVPAR